MIVAILILVLAGSLAGAAVLWWQDASFWGIVAGYVAGGWAGLLAGLPAAMMVRACAAARARARSGLGEKRPRQHQ